MAPINTRQRILRDYLTTRSFPLAGPSDAMRSLFEAMWHRSMAATMKVIQPWPKTRDRWLWKDLREGLERWAQSIISAEEAQRGIRLPKEHP